MAMITRPNLINAKSMEVKLNKSAIDRINEIANQEVLYRKSTYSGRGRPKKSDFVKLKRKELQNYMAFEIFQNSFKTHYIKR